MKLLTILAGCILIAGMLSLVKVDSKAHKLSSIEVEPLPGGYKMEFTRLRNHSTDVRKFIRSHKYNDNFCFLVDMSLPSGRKRFFVYDLKNDSILLKGMVTHGSGKIITDTIQFSNEPETNCSSLGRYRIGNAYFGKFGLAYKLMGLDKTNSNAFKRFIVLHAHPAVPLDETAPEKICTSWGCPTVSPEFLKQLKTYLDERGKPVLLWIFN